jgi:hypothetical protein
VHAQLDQAVQELAEGAAAVRALEVEWGFVDLALLSYSRKSSAADKDTFIKAHDIDTSDEYSG